MNTVIHELGMREVSNDPHIFCASLKAAKESHRFGGLVNARVPDDLQNNGTRLFLSYDNLSGCAVETNGNITAVFKHTQKSGANVPDALMLTALLFGGYKLDCYGGSLEKGTSLSQKIGYLPSLYVNYGFIPVARVLFDPAYAEEGFAEKYEIERDVIVFLHNGDSAEKVRASIRKYKQYGVDEYLKLPLYEYDEALAYREELYHNGLFRNVSAAD